jgi:hypothetical protein
MLGFFKNWGHFFATILKGAVKVAPVAAEAVAGAAAATGTTPAQVGASIAEGLGVKDPQKLSDGLFALAGDVTPQIANLTEEEKQQGKSVFLSPEALSLYVTGAEDIIKLVR